MNESYPCPQCGEVLEIPPEMARQPVRCGACAKVFTPGEAAEFEAAPRRRRRREPTPSGRRTLFIVLGIVGVLGLLCCGGLGFIIYKMMNPVWQPYDSPAGQFTAKFPSGPVTAGSVATGRGAETASGVVATRELLQEDFFVYMVPLSLADSVRKSDKLLQELADGLVKQSGATEERPRVLRSFAGSEALELAMEEIDGRHTQMRIVLANDRAYLVGVTGPGHPDGSPWVQEFLDAFYPTDPAVKPKLKLKK